MKRNFLVRADQLLTGDMIGEHCVISFSPSAPGFMVIGFMRPDKTTYDGEYRTDKEWQVLREVAEPNQSVIDLAALGFDFDLYAHQFPIGNQTAGDGIQTHEFCNPGTGECVMVETNVPNFVPRILSRIYGNHEWEKSTAPVTRGPQITFIIH